MSKLSLKLAALLTALTAVLIVGLQFFSPKPALSNLVDGEQTLIATASRPPSLEPAVLNGKPVYILYVTRSSDTVLVRCYPGFQPTLTVRTMGTAPGSGMTPGKEGVMTCKAAA